MANGTSGTKGGGNGTASATQNAAASADVKFMQIDEDQWVAESENGYGANVFDSGLAFEVRRYMPASELGEGEKQPQVVKANSKAEAFNIASEWINENASKGQNGKITGESIASKLNGKNLSTPYKQAIYSLKDDVKVKNSDKAALAASINKTLKQANTAKGVTKEIWSQQDVRSQVLKVLGSGYKFVPVETNVGHYSFGGKSYPLIQTDYYLRKKK